MATKAEILKAIRRFKNADDEYRRAKHSGAQPRLNKAGTAWAIAQIKLFKLVSPTPAQQEGQT